MPNHFLNGSGLTPQQLKNLCMRFDRELVGVKDGIFWFLIAWTIALLGMEWIQFFTGRFVPASLAAGYGILLGAYIAHKEVLRWTGIAMKIRRGELIVYLWWTMFLAMFIVEYFWNRFRTPEGMITLSYEVLGYFIVTEISKSLNSWRALRMKEKA